MNEYKMIVQWGDGLRSTFFYDAHGVLSAVRLLVREFGDSPIPFEIVAVTKKED